MKYPAAEVAAAIYPDISGVVAEFRPLYAGCPQPLTLAISLVGRTWKGLPHVARVGFAKRVLEKLERENPRQSGFIEAEEKPVVRSQELRHGRGRGAHRRKIDGVRFG